MLVLVVGATGGSGRAAVQALVRAGHDVTALSRHGAAMEGPRVRGVDGDATDPAVVGRLMQGQDAVVVTLGISESAVRVRLRGPARTAADVRSRGTAVVVEQMRRHGVRRLVVQTSYGVGSTRERLPFVNRVVFALLLAPQIADTEKQAAIVHASGLDWVELQPVTLVDHELTSPYVSADGDIRSTRASRAQVGAFLAEAATTSGHAGVYALSDDPKGSAASATTKQHEPRVAR